MIQQGRHRAIPSGDAIEMRSRVSLLQVSDRLLVQQFVGGVRCYAVGCGKRSFFLPHGHRERGQAHANIFKGVEQEDAHDDCEEATECTDDIVRSHVLPLFEEDGRAGEHGRGEEHVVDWRYQGGVENVQSFVQVVDLRAHTAH